MNKDELIVRVSEKLQISKSEAQGAVNAVIDTMQEALAAHDAVSIPGFGKFTVRLNNPRTARNPVTGEAISVPSRYSVKFSAGKNLKEDVR